MPLDVKVKEESTTTKHLQNLPQPNDDIVPETNIKPDVDITNTNLICAGNVGSSDYHDSNCSHTQTKCKKRKIPISKHNLFAKFKKH